MTERDPVPATMPAVRLPGDSTVEHVTLDVPEPGPGQVLLRMRASSICGSDIRAIYREHLGHGAEAYQGVVAGHEPCGDVVAVGQGVRDLVEGDRVVVYHIAGCLRCAECRRGYPVGCTSSTRAAHGWQRDGGHADYMLAEAVSCLPLPDSLTHVDGALVSCGFGTAYEGLLRGRVSGRDRLLVTGLGPVGLAAAMLGRHLGASTVIGSDPSPERVALARELGVVDAAVTDAGELDDVVAEHTAGQGCEVTIDCSGHPDARHAALRSTRTRGRCVFVGEGGRVDFAVSDLLIHQQLEVHGSWVTSLGHMAELLELLDRWGEHPERVVTDRLPLAQAEQAYEIAAAGAAGKVVITWEE
ncbi:zinc-binding dehydrogenase [Marihabitans asiaticum]|uniref:Threonine dehydrogenase-like Zn-dependent dehydrogenase n=1 Tax=Marihabitans asiaticum TaxID=415218 RepID=A0A560WGF0_9MICO|nr:zinc-binding dehydrogenase [Marihabitans asiaticum]TWD16759.1 threonine dehydrogenase-like Zn-dependent dehydrogenase [Marihabitans asiaticum]